MPVAPLTVLLFFVQPETAAGVRVHHDLTVEIFPEEGRLVGSDSMKVIPEGANRLAMVLAENAYNLEIEVNGKKVIVPFRDGRIRLPLGRVKAKSIQVVVRYEALFNDPVPLRPVSTDNPGYGVSGTITKQGCFLLSGSGWYPRMEESRSTYRVRVAAPAGLVAVTAGKSLGHETIEGRTVSIWEIKGGAKALSLSVGPYRVREKIVNGLRAATYFFSETDHLASSYLDATAAYLSLYRNLFGPYPFDKFAVVENFFPTGYGFPGYTLMGSRVLRLPFIIRTSLGHEIAHCWWGNGVLVDYTRGNWSEGLTTYVADHLFKERHSEREAREYRRQLLRNYASFVEPEDDFPLTAFQGRTDPVTKTIGYEKGAMVFHMIRRLIGEDAFWGGLRSICRDHMFKPVSWQDFQDSFERASGLSLERFFDQWVRRKGSPVLRLGHINAQNTQEGWQVKGEILQQKPLYAINTTLVLETEGRKITKTISMEGTVNPFRFETDETPRKLTIDPNVDLFRRLEDREIPASINDLKGSPAVNLITAHVGAVDPVVVDTFKKGLGLNQVRIVPEEAAGPEDLTGADILIIGRPRREDLLPQKTHRTELGKQSFTVSGRRFDHAEHAFFGVFENPHDRNRVLAVLFPVSGPWHRAVARKLTHYGKYSYLVFRKEKNEVRGTWPVTKSPLIHEFND